MFTKLTEKLDNFLEMGIPGYDCIVYHNGKCVYREMKNYNGKELFNIYSCSKLITCVAALQLYEKGVIKLDDNLSKFLPEFKNMTVKTANGIIQAKNSITIKHLFTMTAGFSYDIASPMIKKCQKDTKSEAKTRDVMKYLAKEPLLFEPGYRWEYSLCHDVLATVVEVASCMRFGEYVKKNIFDILEMNNSTFLLDENSIDKIAPQYIYNSETDKTEKYSKINWYKLGTQYESGGAGCISTVEDYIRFIEAIRKGDIILKSETTGLFEKNCLTKEQISMPSYWVEGKRGYSLGQQCPTDENTRPDFGWGGSSGAHYFIDRKNNITAYLGTQILGHQKFLQARKAITPIIQDILK